jgi:dihydrofolate synthase / folylpolyglutamate synthase
LIATKRNNLHGLQAIWIVDSASATLSIAVSIGAVFHFKRQGPEQFQMFDLPKYGDGVCLPRLAALLDVLSVDRARLQRTSVVVTGSNGKGSTAALCAGIGHAHGLRTGLFTSPHLYRFNERFRIDGDLIGDEPLARLVARIETAIAALSQQSNEKYGAFEAMFALACLHFQQQNCDFAVFEAGIGGRYDPVRLVGALQTCVTSVDYEHTALLGNSLESIVSDKSDACADGGVIIYGENCCGLRSHLAGHNRARGRDGLFVGDQIRIGNGVASGTGQRFDFQLGGYEFRSIDMSLSGTFQFNNAAIAIALFLLWSGETRPGADITAIEAAVRSGLSRTRWPGRLEVIAHTPLTVIDVGHTPDAIGQSLASLKAIHGAGGWILVLGVSGDKKADEIVALLAPSFDTIVCTSAYHKGADAEAIAKAARKANPDAALHLAETIEDAAQVSRALADSTNRKIFVAGGLFLAIEYATAAKGGRAQELEFF